MSIVGVKNSQQVNSDESNWFTQLISKRWETKSTMGGLSNKLKQIWTNSSFLIWRNNVPEVHEKDSKDKTQKNNLSCSCTNFLSLISKPLPLLPPFSFYSHFSFSPYPPTVQFPVGFRGYLSHHPLALPFSDHVEALLGVLPLFRLAIQHWMWLTLGEEFH